MPVFEYECLQCGGCFERLVLRTSPAPECPECGARELKQLISLCAMSSEGIREVNLNAAHKKAGSERQERQRDQHKHLHDHFD